MRLFKILNGICQYLAARNKTLWSGTWSSGSITVPDTDKYRTFIIKFGTQYMTAIRNLDDSITGTLFFFSNNGQNVYQNLFTATVSGNRWTFKTQTQFGHRGSSGHSAFQQISSAYVVEEIVGLEPILSEFVDLGGGYCVAGRKGRWLYEIIRHISRPGRPRRARICGRWILGHSKISEWYGDMLLRIPHNCEHYKPIRVRLSLFVGPIEFSDRTIRGNTESVCKLLHARGPMGTGTGPDKRYIQSKAVLSGRISEHDRMAYICFCHRSLEIAPKGVAA